MIRLLNENIHLHDEYCESKNNTAYDNFIRNEMLIQQIFESFHRKNEPNMLYYMFLYYKRTCNSKLSRRYKRRAIHYGLTQEMAANFNQS